MPFACRHAMGIKKMEMSKNSGKTKHILWFLARGDVVQNQSCTTLNLLSKLLSKKFAEQIAEQICFLLSKSSKFAEQKANFAEQIAEQKQIIAEQNSKSALLFAEQIEKFAEQIAVLLSKRVLLSKKQIC